MKIAIAITGASGAIYAQRLLQKLSTPQLSAQAKEISLVFSASAKQVWQYELGEPTINTFGFKVYDSTTYFAPFASGSSKYNSLIICPCSMGTLGRIATGISDNLITRAADVMLKERRQLILVTREMPLNLIQVKNMEKATQAGAIICPASPTFYHKPTTIIELIDTVIDRVLDLAGFTVETKRWES